MHRIMGTLTLNKMNRGKEKKPEKTFIWAGKTIRRPSSGVGFHQSLVCHSAFPPSPEEGKPLQKQIWAVQKLFSPVDISIYPLLIWDFQQTF